MCAAAVTLGYCCILSTERTYSYVNGILGITYISLNVINWLVYVMKSHWIVCEVGTLFLNISGFQMLILRLRSFHLTSKCKQNIQVCHMSKHHNMKAYRENGGEASPLVICRKAINHLLAACDMLGGPHSLSECSCNVRNPFPWLCWPSQFTQQRLVKNRSSCQG
jgi:hypothetical protein